MLHDAFQVGGRHAGAGAPPRARKFQRYLKLGATRIMVIGYGFSDPHMAPTDTLPSGLRMFIIDPLGVQVANPGRGLPMRRVNPFQNAICGVSQLLLTENFGTNALEHRAETNSTGLDPPPIEASFSGPTLSG